jgi:hypothetical protein
MITRSYGRSSFEQSHSRTRGHPDSVLVVTIRVTCPRAAASASMYSTSAAPTAALISITGSHDSSWFTPSRASAVPRTAADNPAALSWGGRHAAPPQAVRLQAESGRWCRDYVCRGG